MLSTAPPLLVFLVALVPASFMPAPAQSSEADAPGTPITADVDRAALANRLLDTLIPLADAGDYLAQFQLGSLYAWGEGLTQDEETAAMWWRKAAEQGYAPAQNELASLLAEGRVVPLDVREAAEWYRKAAEQGLALAQANLGNMYLSGIGVPRNARQAVRWHHKAAEQGLAWAQLYLGDAHASGVGTYVDRREAAEWYRRAAEQDYTDAQYALGLLYLRYGSSVLIHDEDSSEAYGAYWLALAAQNGHAGAGTQLQSMAGRLRRVQLPAATAVRKRPDEDASVIRYAAARERAYLLQELGGRRGSGWTAVYLEEGHTMGFVSTGEMRGK